jgi:Ca2+-binding RTX toxin-like protein
LIGDGSGDDIIVSGEGEDFNNGDVLPGNGTGSGDDIIVSGEGDDGNTGSGGRDIFACGGGEQDTVTDYNEAEGDIATPDCENI